MASAPTLLGARAERKSSVGQKFSLRYSEDEIDTLVPLVADRDRALRELNALAFGPKRRPRIATQIPGGMANKLAEMTSRAERGEAPCRPDDASVEQRTVTGRRRTNGSMPLADFDEVAEQEHLDLEGLDDEAVDQLLNAKAWQEYDTVAWSYRPGSPEWEIRKDEDCELRKDGASVPWSTNKEFLARTTPDERKAA